jgi:CMP-N,N'-diacetyllegionaminic acid synthase
VKTIAIIPARGGSKGIPRKNLCIVAGRPLIEYTFDVAKAVQSLDRIIVSTEDVEIAGFSESCGIEVRNRPASLALDDTPTLPVLLDVIENYLRDYRPDKVVILQPTSPLRSKVHVQQAIELLTDEFDSCISVGQVEHSPHKMFTIRGETLQSFLNLQDRGVPRQRLPAVYRENGAVYATWARVLKDQNSIWGKVTRPLVMDRESSIDIDDPLDLAIAEVLIKKLDQHL